MAVLCVFQIMQIPQRKCNALPYKTGEFVWREYVSIKKRELVGAYYFIASQFMVLYNLCFFVNC
jgi:hypothetical protein